MSKSKSKREAARPMTADEREELICAECCEELQIDTAVSLVQAISELRQVGIIHGQDNAKSYLTPKEEAAYAAALNRLELFMDKELA